MPPTPLPHLRLLRCHGLCAPNQRHCPRYAADRIAFQELSPAPLRCARLTDCCIDTWPAVQRDGEPPRRCRGLALSPARGGVRTHSGHPLPCFAIRLMPAPATSPRAPA